MELGLKNKVVVITGGASGIGLEAARAFLSEGCRVAICGRHAEKLQKAKQELGTDRLLCCQADMTNLAQAEQLAATVVNTWGALDVWVNNAGAMWIKPLMEMTSEEFRREIDLNLTTVFHGAKAAYPHMKKQGGGVILNASSFAALDPNAGRATYSAAKAAVKNLSASMAAEFASAGIRVLAYIPGMIATEIAAESIEKYGDALLADIPCRRYGTPEDVGKVLVFLASDAASYMNGCHVEISGGKRCVQNPQFSYTL